MTQTLSQLENSGAFIERHIGPDAAQQQEMLNAVGAQSLNALTGQIVPKIFSLRHHRRLAHRRPNTPHWQNSRLLPVAINASRLTSAWVTPPCSYRRLSCVTCWKIRAGIPRTLRISLSLRGPPRSMLNFQQVTLDLTGLDMASASLLDEATAAAEAMAMAKRVSKLKNANRFFVASNVHPQTLDVVRTRAETFGFEVIVDDAQKVLDHQDVFGVLLQQVGTTGEIHDYTALISELKSRKLWSALPPILWRWCC